MGGCGRCRSWGRRAEHSISTDLVSRRGEMRSYEGLTTDRINTIFAEEISAREGEVHYTLSDGARLFARATLPLAAELLHGDHVQAGVAIRARAQVISVAPYTFRVICG